MSIEDDIIAAGGRISATAKPGAPVEQPGPEATPQPVGAIAPAQPVTPAVAPSGSPAGDPDSLSLETPKAQVEPEVTLESTGDPALDIALQYFLKQGIKLEDPAIVKAAAGDFSLLEAMLTVKGLKDSSAYLGLAKKAYADNQAAATAKVEAAKKDILSVVGGDTQWDAIRTWASANATDVEKVEVSAALRQGGTVAKAMAQYLKSAYEQAPGNVKQPSPVVTDNARGAAASAAPMSASDYFAAVQALRIKLGGNMDLSPQYKALQAQRAAARAAGY